MWFSEVPVLYNVTKERAGYFRACSIGPLCVISQPFLVFVEAYFFVLYHGICHHHSPPFGECFLELFSEESESKIFSCFLGSKFLVPTFLVKEIRGR